MKRFALHFWNPLDFKMNNFAKNNCVPVIFNLLNLNVTSIEKSIKEIALTCINDLLITVRFQTNEIHVVVKIRH